MFPDPPGADVPAHCATPRSITDRAIPDRIASSRSIAGILILDTTTPDCCVRWNEGWRAKDGAASSDDAAPAGSAANALKTRPNTAMKRIADLTSLIVVHIGCYRLLLEAPDGSDPSEGPNMQALHPNVITGVTLPRRAVTTAVLVVGFALITAAAAQIRIPLPGTPIAITGQTFGVLLAGAALGSRAGAGSMLLYVSLGAVRFPFFAGGESGWTYATGASFGYLVGFVVAAGLIGRFAEQRRDRAIRTAIPAFLLGSAAVYTLGITWLWATVDAIPTFGGALSAGLYPFIAGDLVKAVAAGLLLPAAWYVVKRADS